MDERVWLDERRARASGGNQAAADDQSAWWTSAACGEVGGGRRVTHADGQRRVGRAAQDIVLLLMANAGVIHRAGKAAPVASERFVALVLDGFRAEGASPAPPAPSPRTMIAALSGRAY